MKYASLVRAAAIHDLVLVAPLAIPGGVPLVLGVLGPVNTALGGVAFPEFTGPFSAHYALAIAAGGHPLGWFLLVPEVLWGLAQGVGAAVYRKDELPRDRKTHP